MEQLLTYTIICQTTQKETPTPLARQEIMTDVTSTTDTLISQVTPLLGIMPHESTQLQSMNTPEDVEEILGTRAFQRYVDTPIQTLDGIVVNQPKHFLPLSKELRGLPKRSESRKLMSNGLGYHENNF